MGGPTVEDVSRIAALPDPVVRNLQITHAYAELARTLGVLLGPAANWCTFATWASKQAGQTIRGEDLARAYDDLLRQAPAVRGLIEVAIGYAARRGGRRDAAALHEALRRALDPEAAFRRAADAVARGNRKVFEEIGREFARFLATFGEDEAPDADKVAAFCAVLRPGEPPEGQRLLREAFAAYAEARFEPDEKARAERLFHANLLVGLHEQTRLQPEIAEALDASLGDADALKRRLLTALLPGPWLRLRYHLARLAGRKLPLDEALDRLVEQVRREVRRLISASLMTLRLPGDVVLRLGQDLRAEFPEALRRLADPRLLQLLAEIDASPDSVRGSGARDWADLPDRLHFIADLFRCYHAWPALSEAPFTEAQAAAIRAGRLPPGPL